jgi:hypothetical protein
MDTAHNEGPQQVIIVLRGMAHTERQLGMATVASQHEAKAFEIEQNYEAAIKVINVQFLALI